MIITSQLPVNKWYEVIGEKTIADAILDRIIHDAHRMELKGESLRKKRQAVEENEDVYKSVNLLFLITALTANYTTLCQQNRWSICHETNWSTSTKYPHRASADSIHLKSMKSGKSLSGTFSNLASFILSCRK